MKLKDQTGFKRLALLVTLLSFVVTYIFLILNEGRVSDDEFLLEFPIIALLISLFTYILVRITYWVIDGFSKTDINKTNDENTLETESIQKKIDEDLVEKETSIGKETEKASEIIELEDEVHIDRKMCFDKGCIGTIDENGICNECGRTKHEVENGVQSKNTAPEELVSFTRLGWGWGWLFLSAQYFLALGYGKPTKVYHGSPIILALEMLGFCITLFIYFSLRRYFYKKAFAPNKVWPISFKTGVVSYIFIIFMIFITAFAQGYVKSYERASIAKELQTIFKDASHKKFRTAWDELQQIEDLSTISNITKALKILEVARTERINTERASLKFINYVKTHEKELNQRKLDKILIIKDLHENKINYEYLKSVKDYFDAYEKLLIFSRDNFEKILNDQNPESQQYDVLYNTYVKTLEKQNQLFFVEQKFIQEFSEEHPELSKYIPVYQELDN